MINAEKGIRVPRYIEPDVVEEGLNYCMKGIPGCMGCPYKIYGGRCLGVLMADVEELIHQLKTAAAHSSKED